MTAGRPERPTKPLDFGNGRIAGSVGRTGGLLAVGFYSRRHGYANLECADQFPDDLRNDPIAVRSYRATLADDGGDSLGLHPDGGWEVVAVDAGDDGITPRHRLKAGTLEAEVDTVAAVSGAEALPAVVQRWRVRNIGKRPVEQRLTWGGRVRLGRAALTQLTEGGVLPAASSDHVAHSSGDTLMLSVPKLELEAAVAGLPAPAATEPDGELVRVHAPVDVDLEPGSERRFDLAVAVGNSGDEVRAIALRALDLDHEAKSGRGGTASLLEPQAAWSTVTPSLRAIARRAVAYVLACCAVPTEVGTCLLTDHRILPLTWTRDAYYCARMLLVCSPAQGVTIVGRHLRWLFRAARRPQGFFARSYLPTGEIKDHAFQLDQQCYPLLELVDYVKETGDVGLATDFLPDVRALLAAIEPRRATGHALYSTQETPADDPLALPYHFSSHVLLWHTLRRLQWLWEQLGLDSGLLRQQASAVRYDTTRMFPVDGPADRQYAYAIDLSGGFLLYHDANDLPTVLAPLWGFCSREDPVLEATLAYGFSRSNSRGFFPGPFGGLGSIHTPGAWPLGDVQELLYARLTGDAHRGAAVITRLAATACIDGSLPEARSETSGQVRSRHWFAWPGAALTLALLDPAWQP